MIRADGVWVSRGSRRRTKTAAVAGVSLRVGSGDLLLILGRPGSGKTTLLECLAGLLPVCSGRVELTHSGGTWAWGEGAEAPREARRGIGLLFQYPERQLVGRTPLDDVIEGWELGRDGAMDALRRVGLAESSWDSRMERLSRGEKRRVALAGVLARRPGVLLLDEPAVGLDPQGQELVWEEVRRFRAAGGGVAVATHWPEAVLPLATRVLCLDRGRASFHGAPEGLLEASSGEPCLWELLPFSWRLAVVIGRDGSLPSEAEGWGAAARQWLWAGGPLPRGDQPLPIAPCSASQMPATSCRSPSSRS